MIDEKKRRILDTVIKQPGITLYDLIVTKQCTADEVYSLLASDELYFDAKKYVLADQERVPLFINAEIAYAWERAQDARQVDRMGAPEAFTLEPGLKVSYSGRMWSAGAITEDKVFLVSIDGTEQQPFDREIFERLLDSHVIVPLRDAPERNPVLDRLASLSPKAAETARTREVAVLRYLNGETPKQIGTPKRSLDRWKARYLAEQRASGFGYLGLVPGHDRRGNRVQADPRVLDMVGQVIAEDYLVPERPSVKTAYRILKQRCDEAGVECVSYQAFARRIHRISEYDRARSREGNRSAYQVKAPVIHLTDFTPSGDRPWDRVHIDSTQLDVFLRDSETGLVLGRPWLTLALDAYSRRVLAYHLGFEAPSYRTALCVLRGLVQRHHQLPALLVLDNGKEFDNIYLQQLAGLYRIILEYRPKGAPRGGAMIERIFGLTDQMLIHALVGNNQALKEPRQMTPEVDPRRLAQLTLPALQSLLDGFFYEFYDNRPHRALKGMTPRAKWLKGVTLSGSRESRYIPYDEGFLISTLPSTRKGTGKVVVGKGIKMNYSWYWCPLFTDPQVEGSEVPVKYDPWDLSTAYAFVQGEWVRLTSSYASVLRNRSERELRAVTEEIRKANKETGAWQDATFGDIAKLLIEGKGAIRQVRKEDLEDAKVRGSDGSSGAPKTDSRPAATESSGRFGRSGVPEGVRKIGGLHQ